jgi:DNA-binding MarR family transcriptional regulator
LRLASHGFRTMMDRWLEHYDLSEGRLTVLWRLRAKGETTLGDLAESLDVSPRNITGLVDHLERDALVERFPDPDDRRATHVRLSPAGKQKLSDIKTQMGNAQHGVVAGFSDEELKQLRHLCLKLARNMIASKELEKV